ncbi:response regulator transcription factor [Parahaliea sp. F7430]|uniref:Response regulator transcription factor n=1 Tax=Sediminihaliea albiluteola TaxID=2758564 RepID=A0A7W2TVC4_9GAMM|nr:response regulator transcription factor [Sediminihaliea albiluteola]MBA6412585.1 response regulator transcription factor [Sediminihaliea albiluteola]
MNVLLVEDDPSVGEFIASELATAGYNCTLKSDGLEGLEAALRGDFDIVVVDRMLPSLDGLSIVSRLREAGHLTPVLVLSALAEVEDRVKGLHSGADDYLTKPFSMAELQARLEVLYRRANNPSETQTRLQVADLEMDLLSQEVRRQQDLINLQPREYKLLEFLMRHAGQVVTRAMLLEHVWGYHFDPQTNVIDVHVSRLRQKIDRGFDTPLLTTVRGAGYRLGSP